jgi:hypothetical protein
VLTVETTGVPVARYSMSLEGNTYRADAWLAEWGFTSTDARR